MKVSHLHERKNGWIAGDFDGALIRMKEAEAAVQHYVQGASEPWHVHKVATEITVVVQGTVEMFHGRYNAGAIILLEPGEGTSFKALTDAVTVVFKTPSIPSDKHTRADVEKEEREATLKQNAVDELVRETERLELYGKK